MPDETLTKVQSIEAQAQAAYDRDDRDWFYRAPLDHLAVLWGIACAAGAAYDDEVYDALDQRGWFD